MPLLTRPHPLSPLLQLHSCYSTFLPHTPPCHITLHQTTPPLTNFPSLSLSFLSLSLHSFCCSLSFLHDFFSSCTLQNSYQPCITTPISSTPIYSPNSTTFPFPLNPHLVQNPYISTPLSPLQPISPLHLPNPLQPPSNIHITNVIPPHSHRNSNLRSLTKISTSLTS